MIQAQKLQNRSKFNLKLQKKVENLNDGFCFRILKTLKMGVEHQISQSKQN
jgi:hypothetical protein